jgi:glycolate oxidase FAD binding subunit
MADLAIGAAAETAREHGTLVRERFERLLGAGAVQEGSLRWKIGARTPPIVLTPSSEDQLSDCLRVASERGWSIVPAGVGSWFTAGNSVHSADAILSVSRLDRIVQYEPADLTLTASAGLSLGGLDVLVAQEGQWLPLDPPGLDEGTLGGTLATASAGGLAMAYGGPRDLVLGLRVVTGDGRVLRLGGRVVKNVAGFDLVKLLVGSWGTLGVITEATFRLFPRPQQVLCLVGRSDRLEDLLEGALRVGRARIVPAAVELLESPVDGPGSHREAVLVVRLVGLEERVAREATLLEAALSPLDVERLDGRSPEGAELISRVRHVEEDADLTLRFVGPLSHLAELLTVARAGGRLHAGHDELTSAPYRLAVDAQRGSLRLVIPRVRVDPPWAERWATRILELRGNAEFRDGSLTIAKGPPAVIDGCGAWGKLGGSARLMAGLKAQFDPGGVLSPGRLSFAED